jgi:phenylpyruvate tautomerase PptA (4-oxalocrotonate tautomerase family)
MTQNPIWCGVALSNDVFRSIALLDETRSSASICVHLRLVFSLRSLRSFAAIPSVGLPLRILVLARASTPLKEQSMPYLSIQTNVGLEEEAQKRLLTEASKIVATTLNKPEKYVMVAWTPAPKMTFDSDPNGTAFLELRSIGIPEASRQKLPGALAKCMSDNLGIDADRVYLVMMDVPGKYWAEGEQTFG